MNIKIQLKNSDNPNIKGYKTLNIEENKESNDFEGNKIKREMESQEKIEKEEAFFKKIISEEYIIQKYNKQKNTIKSRIKTLLLGLFYCFYLTSIFFYIKSLEGCLKDDLVECLVDDAIAKYVFAGNLSHFSYYFLIFSYKYYLYTHPLYFDQVTSLHKQLSGFEDLVHFSKIFSGAPLI